ncbi:replication protein P [Hahella sp. NBU794]|uniref:replication protein P n=1 Tax=Hahella sp. NBU794 TaxID=3422590 RepID=UPI003D6F3BB4
MKSVNEISLSVQAQIAKPQAPVAMAAHTSINDKARENVNAIFKALQASFPAWRQAFPDTESLLEAKRAWTKAMVENRITSADQIRVGIRRARATACPFFPSIGQFVSWCKPEPEDFGLLPTPAAYRMACDGLQQLERGESLAYLAVRIAARATGSYELRVRTEREMLPLFSRNYDIVCRRVMNGEDIQADIPKALPEQPAKASKPVSREEARRRMADLLKSVSASS